MEIENILVVDDEEAIREVVSTMLESKGYRCTAVQKQRRRAVGHALGVHRVDEAEVIDVPVHLGE